MKEITGNASLHGRFRPHRFAIANGSACKVSEDSEICVTCDHFQLYMV